MEPELVIYRNYNIHRPQRPLKTQDNSRKILSPLSPRKLAVHQSLFPFSFFLITCRFWTLPFTCLSLGFFWLKCLAIIFIYDIWDWALLNQARLTHYTMQMGPQTLNACGRHWPLRQPKVPQHVANLAYWALSLLPTLREELHSAIGNISFLPRSGWPRATCHSAQQVGLFGKYQLQSVHWIE